MIRIPEYVARSLAAAAAVALVAPASGEPWWAYRDLPAAAKGLDGEYGLSGGYDAYDGNDWYFDHYDAGDRFGARAVGGEYDDAYLDYYIDATDAREEVERVGDADVDGRRSVEGSDDDRPWYGDTYMDWDTYPDEDSFESGGVYEGFGYDQGR